MMRWLMLLPIAGIAMTVLETRAAAPQAPAPPKKEGPGLDFTGRIEAPTVEIRPRVTGVLEKILVKDGAAVQAGEVLAEIDPRQYQADVEVAKAKLAVAEAASRAASASLARTKSAVGRGILTKEDMTQSEAEQIRSDAMVRAANAEMGLADLNLSWTKIRTPMAGTVSRFSRTVASRPVNRILR